MIKNNTKLPSIRTNIFILIFFSNLLFSLSQKTYERNRLQLNTLFSLQQNKSYLFVISFSNNTKFDKLDFFNYNR